MTIRQYVLRKIKKWQKRLLLTEWVVTFELVDIDEFEQCCHYRLTEKTAHIVLTTRTDMKRLEHDIAHELSHIIIAPIDRHIEDWLNAHLSKKERKVFAENYNKWCNEVIDHYLRTMGL